MLDLILGSVLAWLTFAVALMYPAKWFFSEAGSRTGLYMTKYEDSLKVSAVLLVLVFVLQGVIYMLQSIHVVLSGLLSVCLLVGIYFVIYKKVVWWKPIVAGILSTIMLSVFGGILFIIGALL